MKKIEKTDDQKKAYINALAHKEVKFANSSILEWPTLFSNLIEPRKKDLPTARAFYEALTNEEIETRLAVHSWESRSWDIYDDLMGFSLMHISRSIDPRLWASHR